MAGMRAQILSNVVLGSLLGALIGLAPTGALADGIARSDIDRALRLWARDKETPSRFKFAEVDLTGDSVAEVVALLTDPSYCGSGGCTLVVMHQTAGRLSVVSSSTVTREPICVAAETSYGWHTLIVSVGGGGLAFGRRQLRFNGSRYPLNPAIQPKPVQAMLKSCKELDLQDANTR